MSCCYGYSEDKRAAADDITPAMILFTALPLPRLITREAITMLQHADIEAMLRSMAMALTSIGGAAMPARWPFFGEMIYASQKRTYASAPITPPIYIERAHAAKMLLLIFMLISCRQRR